MRCPVCHGRLAITKTVNLSDFLVMRYRLCTTTICPFVSKTYEALNVPDDQLAIEDLLFFIGESAENLGKDAIAEKLALLAKELSGRN